MAHKPRNLCAAANKKGDGSPVQPACPVRPVCARRPPSLRARNGPPAQKLKCAKPTRLYLLQARLVDDGVRPALLHHGRGGRWLLIAVLLLIARWVWRGLRVAARIFHVLILVVLHAQSNLMGAAAPASLQDGLAIGCSLQVLI